MNLMNNAHKNYDQSARKSASDELDKEILQDSWWSSNK